MNPCQESLFRKGQRERTVGKKSCSPGVDRRSPSDYYLTALSDLPGLYAVVHPRNDLWLRQQTLTLCRKRLSTEAVAALEALYASTADGVCRQQLARKIHQLRRDYLDAHREYSDRRLVMLAERENLFDKWEGIYILGCFGGDEALRYLEERLGREQKPLLQHTIRQAMKKLRDKKTRMQKERGF